MEINSCNNNIKDYKDFFDLINLYSIGLERVRELVEKNEYEKAFKAYRVYLKQRLDNFDLGQLKGDPNTAVEKAENIMRNKISLCESPLHDIGDPVNWFITPDGDKQWQSHLGYMYWPNSLVYAYKQTRNKKYINKWSKMIEDFITNHPWGVEGLEYDPSYPMYLSEYSYKCGGEGRYPGYLGGTWIALGSAIRAGHWVASIKLLIDSENFTDDLLLMMLESLINDHAYNMINNARRYTPNQFLHISIELTKIGIVFSEFKNAPACYLVGIQRLEESINLCVLPDGTDLEQSFNYNSVLPHYFHVIYCLYKNKPTKRIEELYKKIKERVGFLSFIINPLRQWPDIAKGHLHDSIPAIKDMAKMYRDDKIERVIEWIENQQDDSEVSFTSIAFPYGGYYVMRSGWRSNDQYMFFKTSRRAAGHMHEDCNSIFLTAFGRNILIDSGNYNYSDDELSKTINRYFFASFSHNTICVDDEGQNRMEASVAIKDEPGFTNDHILDEVERLKALQKPINKRWHTSKYFDFSEGEYSDGYGTSNINVAHERQVFFIKEGIWIVLDRMRAEGNHKYTLNWQLSPEYEQEDVAIDTDNNCIYTKDDKGANIAIYSFNNGTSLHYEKKYGEEEPYSGWYAREYNQMEKSIDVRVNWEGENDQLMVSCLYPFMGSKHNIKDIKPISNSIENNNACGFKLILTDDEEIIFISRANEEPIEFETISFIGESLLVLKDKTENTRGLALGCREIVINGEKQSIYGDFEFEIRDDMIKAVSMISCG